MRAHRILLRIFCMLLLIVSRSLGFGQGTQDSSLANVGNTALRSELLAMAKDDQGIRAEWIQRMPAHTVDSAFVATMDSIDRAGTAHIKKIIAKYGWPGKSLVGNDGSEAAFLIVQHSRDTLFQESCLPLVKSAYELKEVSGNDVALLTDRVYVHEGKKQLYGSQAELVKGKLVFDQIEDEANVDKLRAELGLPSMAEYKKMLEEMYHLDVK